MKPWRITAAALLISASAQAQNVTVIGPVTPGNLSQFNSTTVIRDSGTAGPTSPALATPVAYPCTPALPALFPTCNNPIAQSPLIVGGPVWCPLQQNCGYTGNNVFPFSVLGSNPLTAGYNITFNTPAPGRIHALTFTSPLLTGSPITVSFTDVTSSAVDAAVGLCTAIMQNSTLHGANGLPIICDPITGGGTANLAASILLYTPYAASSLVVADASSGGASITLGTLSTNLDTAVVVLGRNIPGYTGRVGDNAMSLQFDGQNSSGGLQAIGSITAVVADPSATFTGTLIFGASYQGPGVAQMSIRNGLYLYGNTQAPPGGGVGGSGFMGPGTFNFPGSAGGALGFDGVIWAAAAGLTAPGGNVFGGTAAGSILTLQSTSSGAPVGDAIQMIAGGVVRERIWNSGGVSIGTAVDPAAAGVLTVSTGYRVANAAPTGNYLRGNGTNFVASAIATADLPANAGWLNRVVITTVGANTYNQIAGSNGILVRCVGGGGAGGGAAAAAAAQVAGGGGGGGGGYAEKRIVASGLTGITVTIGAGGTPGAAGANPGGNGTASSFATGPLTASGGNGGSGGISFTPFTAVQGGNGGGATGGDLNAGGQNGGPSLYINSALAIGGAGGAPAAFGAGTAQVAAAASFPGTAGSNYGGGGSGAGSVASGTAGAGGAGASGICIIDEFH